MKYTFFLIFLSFASCSERVTTSFKVLNNKAEDRLVVLAGDVEVANELYKNQYVALKDRLVKLKTFQALFSERLDQAYAFNDARRIQVYSERLIELKTKIPEAENSLREFYIIYQQQKEEFSLLKEQLGVYKASGLLSENLEVTSEYEHRAETISSLKDRMKEQVKHAQSLMQVGKFEEAIIH